MSQRYHIPLISIGLLGFLFTSCSSITTSSTSQEESISTSETSVNSVAEPLQEELVGVLPTHWEEGLAPGINWGLAQKYPNDVNIKTDTNVLASEDFETGTVTIPTERDVYKLDPITKHGTKVVSSQHYTGRYAGEHSWEENFNGPTARYVIPDKAHASVNQAYFMRMCFKYDQSFHPCKNDPSKCSGKDDSGVSRPCSGSDAGFDAKACDKMSGVGVKGFGIYYEPLGAKLDMTNCADPPWFNVSCQFVGWGPSNKSAANDRFVWEGHMYSYNPHAKTAHVGSDAGTLNLPDGACRFSGYPNPHAYVKFDDWHCYEVGLYLNTPGKADGESRFWIDGELKTRIVNMQFRDAERQRPNSMHLNLHRTTEKFAKPMIRWVDNIVLATRYIGPVKRP